MADLIVLTFGETHGAQHAMAAIRDLTQLDRAWVDDIAVVERHRSGRISTHTTHGSVTAGAYFGGLTGMLIGLLFPPFGFLALFAVGAGAGALTQRLIKETGLDKHMLDEIKGALDKGTSALIMIGAQGDVDDMAHAFDDYRPTSTIRRALPDETVDGLREAIDQGHREQGREHDPGSK